MSGHAAYLASLGEDQEGVIDNADVFKDDPGAPSWIREWRGPFTIRITKRASRESTTVRVAELAAGHGTSTPALEPRPRAEQDPRVEAISRPCAELPGSQSIGRHERPDTPSAGLSLSELMAAVRRLSEDDYTTLRDSMRAWDYADYEGEPEDLARLRHE
jgi:hypothetical protein